MVSWYKFEDPKSFDNENSTKRYDVDEYYEKLSLLIGLDPKDKKPDRFTKCYLFWNLAKCDPVKLDELIDFDKGKDISKEFRENINQIHFGINREKIGLF